MSRDIRFQGLETFVSGSRCPGLFLVVLFGLQKQKTCRCVIVLGGLFRGCRRRWILGAKVAIKDVDF